VDLAGIEPAHGGVPSTKSLGFRRRLAFQARAHRPLRFLSPLRLRPWTRATDKRKSSSFARRCQATLATQPPAVRVPTVREGVVSDLRQERQEL
jgi:hypothetical protein